MNGVPNAHANDAAPERLVSYAQTGEDIVLQRALRDRPTGFYIDIGACDPAIDSVTLLFYERGWHGVNVEPDHVLFAAFPPARPHDANICAAVGDTRGKRDFYATGTRGHGTLRSDLASERSGGREPERVPVITLADVFDCYGPDDGGVDFLKIDVEGSEADVIRSGDWARHRPRVVVVEAVDIAGRPTHAEWEWLLLEAGYRFALFDGLNRFYCRAEDEGLLPLLAVPANPIDNFVRAAEVHAAALDHERHELAGRVAALTAERDAANAAERTAREQSDALAAQLQSARERADLLTADVARARSEAAAALRREENVEERLAELELEAVRRDVEVAAMRDAHERNAMERQQLLLTLAQLTAARYESQTALAAIQASLSWRVTLPLRLAARVARSARSARLRALLRDSLRRRTAR